MRYVLVNAVGGRPAGEILNDQQGDAATIAGLPAIGGILVPLPNAVMEAAALRATAAYARGAGDAVATGIMLGGYTDAAGAVTTIAWKPDGSGDATTWADVMAYVQSSTTPIDVWLDESGAYVIPEGTYDVRGLVFQAPRSPFGYATVTLPEGARLHQCGGVAGSVQLIGTCTASPCLSFENGVGVIPHVLFHVSESAQIINNGAVPMVQVPSGSGLAILVERIGFLLGGTPIVQATGAQIALLVTDMALSLANDWAIGDAGSTIVYVHDGSLFFPTNTGFGTRQNVPFGQDGGYGPTSFRPIGIFQPPKPGCIYRDTDLGSLIEWDGSAWQPIGGGSGGDAFPFRTDHSVNSARVDRLYDTKPILRTRSAGHVAGGYNGGGVGNKAIIGFPVASSAPLASLVSLEWTYRNRGIGTTTNTVYANIMLDVNGDGSAWKVAVVDPTSLFVLNNGTTVTNGDGSKTTTWLAASNNFLIVLGLDGPPLPPGVGFVPPTVAGAPLPAGWLTNSYSVADILAAYPACRYGVAASGDGGLPKTPIQTAAFILCTGDSGNNLEAAWELQDVKFNGVPV